MTSTTITSRPYAFTAIGLFALLGCNDSAIKQDASVQGTVIVDGELATQGIVAFHPDDGGAVAYGTIHSDGSYALRIGQGQRNDLDNSKIYPGKYTATVAVTSPSSDKKEEIGNLREPSPRINDTKFSNKNTSGLMYEVASGRNIINISVERAPLDELVDAEKLEIDAAEDGQVLSGEHAPQGEESAEGESDAEEGVRAKGVEEEPTQ